MRLIRTILPVMGVTVFLLGRAAAALAYCAMCQTSLLSSPEGQQLVEGFRSGFLLLLAAPLLVSGVVAFLLIRGHLPFYSQHPARTSSPANETVEPVSRFSIRRELGWPPETGTPATQQ